MRVFGIGVCIVGIFCASALPGAAQPLPPGLVSPTGIVDGSSHTFTWRARAGATWYQLWISDAVQSPRLAEWYTAAQAGCAEGTGMCSVTLALDLADGHVAWWVRSYNAAGNGPWSPQMNVFVRRTPGAWSVGLPAALRFQLVLDSEAVLDRETGLVWERTPDATAGNLAAAHGKCMQAETGSRRGWRIPTFAELASLGVAGEGTLPEGHPFNVGANARFWTQSTLGTTGFYKVVLFGPPFVATAALPAETSPRAWCVRGAGDDQ